MSYERPLGIAVVAIDGGARSLAGAVMEAARLLDVVGVLDERHLVVVMPELTAEATHAAALRVVEAIASTGSGSRGVSLGLASCPSDACAAEALIAAARGAATRGPG